MVDERLIKLLTGVLISCLMLTSPGLCWAYKANVGSRAANIKSFDIIDREAVELEQFLGQWVLVEFWASWCGPCVRELPNLIQQTKPFIDRGELAVLSISIDDSSTLSNLKKLIDQYNIDFPVLYDGASGSLDTVPTAIPAAEWQVDGVPSSYLVNPQGVIVITQARGSKLGQTLQYFIDDDPRPLMGIDNWQVIHEDGSISVYANIWNTYRENIKIELYTYQVRLLWDKQEEQYIEEIINTDKLVDTTIIEFTDFCESTCEFLIPSDKDLYVFVPVLEAIIPGTEHITGIDNKPGLRLYSEGDWIILLDVEYSDGEYKVKGSLY